MGLGEIPEISYGDFGDRLYGEIIQKRIPVHGSMELTFRCNLRCVHCYCNLPALDREAMKRELSLGEVVDILDQLAEEGCLWLLFTGGEPLIRKDFTDILASAKKKGFLITLFTNGTLVTQEKADCLAEWSPLAIEISIYGASSETHDRITGVHGSYRDTLRGIELLLARGLPLELKTMVMTLNKHELLEMKALAEGLGLKFRFDPVINPRLDGSRVPCKLRLSPEEVLDLDLSDEERTREWRLFCEEFIGEQEGGRLFSCGAGVSTFHIDPYGELAPCEVSRFRTYSLRQGSFREGWREFIPGLLEQRAGKDYPCSGCELLDLCGQCPGMAWLEHREIQTPVEYLCRIAHLRAEAFHGG